jgi:hypothetical protein
MKKRGKKEVEVKRSAFPTASLFLLGSSLPEAETNSKYSVAESGTPCGNPVEAVEKENKSNSCTTAFPQTLERVHLTRKSRNVQVREVQAP